MYRNGVCFTWLESEGVGRIGMGGGFTCVCKREVGCMGMDR